MRLISCHIENFGKLQDRTFKFDKGLNTICMENGAGKSTLAAFIKVMLFGFENEGKRDELENERKRYTPWQGGVYGGTLVFESEGKEYEIEKTFGKKDKDDTFVLRDMSTQLVSDAFDSNVGEKLFGLNRDSFVRSAFISQGGCESTISDGINAKMGNLVDNTDDMNRYEVVMGKLDEMLNKLSATRKTGEISKLKSDLNELSVKIKSGESIDDTVESVLKKSEADKAWYGQLKEEQQKLLDKQKEVSVYKDSKALKDKYEELIKQEQGRRENYDKVVSSFAGSVPKEDELSAMTEKASKLSMMKGTLKGLEQFNDTEIKDRSKALQESLEKYELKFATGIPTDAEISRLVGEWGKRSEQKNTLSQRKSTLQTLMDIDDDKKAKVEEDYIKKAKSSSLVAIILAVVGILALACAVTGIGGESLKIVEYGVAAVCIIVAIVMFVIAAGHKKTAANIVFPLNPQMIELREEIDNDETFIRDTYSYTEDFFIRYNLPFDEYTVINELYNLKNDIAAYEQLKETGREDIEKYKAKEEEYKAAKAEYDSLREEVTVYIKKLGFDEDADPVETLNKCQAMYKDYEAAKKEYDKAKENKAFFEEHNPGYEKLKELKAPENEESMEANEARLRTIQVDIERLSRNIESYKRELDDYRTRREEVAGYENELADKTELLAEKNKMLDTATKTKEFMEQAKIALTTKYTGPITEGFNKYYHMLEDGKAEDNDKYSFDAHINLEFKEQGQRHGTGFLSQGLKDLSGVALRMAFVDAMYTEEKPFVVFDDPYVNLDEKRLNGGLKLLESMAADHQIIYFTCQDSRVPAGADR